MDKILLIAGILGLAYLVNKSEPATISVLIPASGSVPAQSPAVSSDPVSAIQYSDGGGGGGGPLGGNDSGKFIFNGGAFDPRYSIFQHLAWVSSIPVNEYPQVTGVINV